MAEISNDKLKEYKDLERKYKTIKERQKNQFKRQNEYIKEKFYRASVTFPKEYKDYIAAAGVGSVNGYINALVKADLQRRGIIQKTVAERFREELERREMEESANSADEVNSERVEDDDDEPPF